MFPPQRCLTVTERLSCRVSAARDVNQNRRGDRKRSADPQTFASVCFGCRSPVKPFLCLDDVTDSSQCRPTTARRRHRPPRAFSPPSLIMQSHPPRRRLPARPPRSAAGCPTAAKRPPAARTHGAPSTGSPSCFRSDSPGRR